MRILRKTAFDEGAIHVDPGDTITVTYYRDGAAVAKCKTVIEEAQTIDSAALVEYTKEEAAAFGMETAFGTFAGESQ